jgi:vacuolar-type H+-ATPase subunit I/STV1
MPGIATTQHKHNDKRGSLSLMPASSPALATTPLRHGVVSPMQQAHDMSKLMRDLLARVVKVEAEVVGLKEETLMQDLLARVAIMKAEVGGLRRENGRRKEDLSQEKKKRERRDKEMEKLKQLNKQMVEEKEDIQGVRSVMETLMNNVEKNVFRSGVKEAMKTMEAETREMRGLRRK